MVAPALLWSVLSTKSGAVITAALLSVLGIYQSWLFLSQLWTRWAFSPLQTEQSGVAGAMDQSKKQGQAVTNTEI